MCLCGSKLIELFVVRRVAAACCWQGGGRRRQSSSFPLFPQTASAEDARRSVCLSATDESERGVCVCVCLMLGSCMRFVPFFLICFLDLQSEKMGLGRMVMKDHQTPPPGPAQLTKSLPPLPPPKSHLVTTPTASVFPTATEPLPDPVRPLSLSTSLVPVTSVNPATIAESLPTVIGPTAHLASGAVSGDGHMISRGVSHDQQKGHLFSSSTEEDQMRHIEKVWNPTASTFCAVCRIFSK